MCRKEYHREQLAKDVRLASKMGGERDLPAQSGCRSIKDEFLHLDVALSVVRPGLAVICPDAFADKIPSYFGGWKLIEVSKDEAQRLAINGLPIDPDHYILSYNEHYDGWRVQKALEAEGITVHRIAFDNHNEDGGSVRCATHPLARRLNSRA